jgi:hypothetical protein
MTARGDPQPPFDGEGQLSALERQLLAHLRPGETDPDPPDATEQS